VWNAHASIGNIICKLIATALLSSFGWYASFMGMGALLGFVGVLQLLFIVPHPEDVLTRAELAELTRINAKGHIAKTAEEFEHTHTTKVKQRNQVQSAPPIADRAALHRVEDAHHEIKLGEPMSAPVPHHLDEAASSLSVPEAPQSPRHHDEYEEISFLTGLMVPGVLEYSACLFFSKLVAYAFSFWLPSFLTSLHYSDTAAGNLSTVFDMGGILGGIVAGGASDRSGKRGLVSCVMLLLCLPALQLYNSVASAGIAVNIIVMFLVGVLVNGPYTLISSAVAADLGNHPSLKGNPKAMSTVTGIIDGCGSVGAALQGVLIGMVGNRIGWGNVFYMLMAFCFMSALTLTRLVRKEVGPPSTWRRVWPCGSRRARSSSAATESGASTPHTAHEEDHAVSAVHFDERRRLSTSDPRLLRRQPPVDVLQSPSLVSQPDGHTVPSSGNGEWPGHHNSLEMKQAELRASLLNASHNGVAPQ